MRDRRVLIGTAAAIIVGAAVMNWNWLVAIGAAPLIVALALCAAMCALGLCTNGNATDSCQKSAAPASLDDHGPPVAGQAARGSDPNPMGRARSRSIGNVPLSYRT
ncbi:hypothetical protein [Microvirga sp. VF16]|uniref:hypothetical protein n=1 Tax=Microvirga sp. VF16 TaxID=2807101 RepID=UPI00193E9582|nr:hypothetical protein [Microvirga sp. VF16]QRM35300.1 hypothetical protein JO965_40795 [Microvirga sp. VF16]